MNNNIYNTIIKNIIAKIKGERVEPIEDIIRKGQYHRPNYNGTAPGQAFFSTPQETMELGNTIFHKDYQKAIDDGLKLLEDYPNDPMVHINLMNAYFNGRDLAPGYFDKSTEHAKLAILYGHHTGFAEYRLAVNLERKKFYYQSLQLYKLILETPGFHFSKCGMGQNIDFRARREKAIQKLPKALDDDSFILFSDVEIQQIIQGIKDADAAEAKAQEDFRKRQQKFWDEFYKE